MTTMRPVRGMHDILPMESEKFRYIADTCYRIAKLYGYGEIHTPIMEFSEVFSRTLGDTSDIVTKEMYTFPDRHGDMMTLRPEGTASVVRAILTHGLAHQLPLKLFYQGPMFRYERPQKGRQRQFHQVGCEFLGVDSPYADVESITLAYHILAILGVADHATLQLNSLGDQESRTRYRQALVDFFNDYRTDLSVDSQHRLDRNPLRILDSKDPQDQPIIEKAPVLTEFFTSESHDFFETVKADLGRMGMPFVLNPRLVRGLDYYCHTTFEFTSTALGAAQATVLAGGRYDGLVEMMGGPSMPAVGWAAGIERLMMLMNADQIPTSHSVSVIPADDTSHDVCRELVQALRFADIESDMAYSGNLAKRLKRADKIGSELAMIIGESELNSNIVQVKNLGDGSVENVPFETVVAFVLNYFYEKDSDEKVALDDVMESFLGVQADHEDDDDDRHRH